MNRNGFKQIHTITYIEELTWQNAQSVEKMLKLQKKLGQWQENLTNKENVPS